MGSSAGFLLGLAFIFFALIARVFIEYPYRPTSLRLPVYYFQKYWELGLWRPLYNLAIWVDKWVMWFAPEGSVRAGVLMSYSDYDGAMFLAYLSIVPGMSLFLVSLETRSTSNTWTSTATSSVMPPMTRLPRTTGRMMRLLAEASATSRDAGGGVLSRRGAGAAAARRARHQPAPARIFRSACSGRCFTP